MSKTRRTVPSSGNDQRWTPAGYGLPVASCVESGILTS